MRLYFLFSPNKINVIVSAAGLTILRILPLTCEMTCQLTGLFASLAWDDPCQHQV